jgi:hypothetical protein
MSGTSVADERAAKGTNFDYVTQAYDQAAAERLLREIPRDDQAAAGSLLREIRHRRVQYGQYARHSAGAFAMLPSNENPDVAREFAVAYQVAALQAAPLKRSRKLRG